MKINLPSTLTYVCLDKVLLVLSSLQLPTKQLTQVEIMILREFMLLPTKFDYFRFSSLAKSEVLKALASKGFKISRSNLNNRIYDLVDKSYVKRDSDKVLYLSPFLETIRKSLSQKTFDVTITFNHDSQSTPDNKPDNPTM